MLIRKFDEDEDTRSLRDCLIELQEFERRVDSRMPAGEEIADAYMSDMFLQCAMSKGTIFVADMDGRVVGFATLLSQCSSGELDDGDIEFALLSDIVVREDCRGQGVGRQLLQVCRGTSSKRWRTMAKGFGTCQEPARETTL